MSANVPLGMPVPVSWSVRGSASGGAGFKYLPLTGDHDLTDGWCYAGLLIGHGPEPWVSCAASDWMRAAEAELERRGLPAEAKRVRKVLLREHRARKNAAGVPGGR